MIAVSQSGQNRQMAISQLLVIVKQSITTHHLLHSTGIPLLFLLGGVNMFKKGI